MLSSILLSGAFAAFATLVAGANQYSDNDWANNRQYIVKDAAPFWHFATGACYPQAAEVNGAQTNGNYPSGDACIIDHLPKGCQDPRPWNGANTRGSAFPTYWTAKRCGDSWRITYSLYFRHDSGHESDWEFLTVIFKKGGDGLWYRDSVIMEQDGSNVHVNYGDLITWNSNNLNDDSQHNGNHPKVYVAKFHHAIWKNQYKSNKSNCAVLNDKMFRVNDYVYPAADYLVGGQVIPVGWNWGKAASSPMAMYGEGNQNVCNK